jgi:hypothetical protein
MAHKRKTWQEKMHPNMVAKVETTMRQFADIPPGVTMLVANPEVVEAYIKDIPEGTHTSLQQMRKDLAAEYNAAYCCPVTSGIFLRIVAEAAHEAITEGKTVDEVAPFWRMIDAKAPVAKKLSFGTDFVKAQRAKEGLAF